MTHSATLTGYRYPVFFGTKDQQRRRLAGDVEAYLRSGGVVQLLPPAGHRERVTLETIERLKGIYREL